ncbi:unnamed protein product [Closterium sp. Naga37s-1]|nr:unnamed protein product [Closterium sp. Naga37s-1]
MRSRGRLGPGASRQPETDRWVLCGAGQRAPQGGGGPVGPVRCWPASSPGGRRTGGSCAVLASELPRGEEDRWVLCGAGQRAPQGGGGPVGPVRCWPASSPGGRRTGWLPENKPPFLHLSASLPSLPSLLPVLPSSLPPSLCLPTLFTLSVARPPFLPSFFPAILPLLILPRSSPPSPFHLPLSHSLPLANPAPPFHPSTFPLVPSRTFSSHPPIISSAHPLIRPSSHPPIISSAHHLIRPSSHPPILSSAHPLTVAHASALVPFRALSPTHASSRSPFRPSSVSPLLIFCLRAFFVPHPPSELVVRVCAGLPCIQL